MKNLPSVLFVVLVILVAFAFVTSCSSPAETERARSETRRQEVLLEQARADRKIAEADAFSEKSQAVFPYAMIAIFVGAGLLVFCAWYLRRSEAPQGYWQEQPAPRAVQVAAPAQPAQLPPPPAQQQAQLPSIVINLMLAGSADTRPLMQTYYSDYRNGDQPYLIEAQPAREVARLVD